MGLGVALQALDTNGSRAARTGGEQVVASSPITSCEGARAPLPDALLIHLRSGAFAPSAHADVAVHVPTGFDATRRPGVILYFHGWQGCVTAALATVDVPCDENASPRPAADLAAQIDAAGVNAVLVAIELRVDASTGEPGRLALPAGAHELIRELFVEHLAAPLGCALEVDAIDRIVLVAHSGGYRAAASVIEEGDLPQITEVDLLDALYGAEDVFARWMADAIDRFDGRPRTGLRFVDLYTCCGGTSESSRVMARSAEEALSHVGLAASVYDDDESSELGGAALSRPVVFKRVPEIHGQLPRAYVRQLVEGAGFARRRSLLP